MKLNNKKLFYILIACIALFYGLAITVGLLIAYEISTVKSEDVGNAAGRVVKGYNDAIKDK